MGITRFNAILIKHCKSQAERMQSLHELAVQQMTMQGKVSMHVGMHIAKLIGRVCGAKRPHSVSEQPIAAVFE